jgi:predicted amidohydrolase
VSQRSEPPEQRNAGSAARLRVAGVQHDIRWEDRDATLALLEAPVEAAAALGARLVVLTEMFAVGFTSQTDRVAEPPDGPTTQWLGAHAAALDLWICGSVPVTTGGKPANRLVLAGPDGQRVTYDKIHPFTYAGEHTRFSPGAEAVNTAIDGVRTNLSVCYDLRFADQYWGVAPTTDLYVVVANWPASRRHHWRSLLVARAIENQAYVVGVNRIGSGGKESYAGDSCIVDPLGEVLVQAAGVETIVSAEVDPEVVSATRARFPFLADRVPVTFTG